MKLFPALLILFLAFKVSSAAPPPNAPVKMRPYSGIGIFVISATGKNDLSEPYQIYREPAFTRIGDLNVGQIPPYEWIFGKSDGTLHLLVMSRREGWLRVAYDDAGREAWLNPRRASAFHPWEAFLKGQPIRLLPGLHKKYYQLFPQPGMGAASISSHRKLFTVVRIESDWAQVVSGESELGWLRWRDEDGRLTISLGKAVQ
jgi:hypothetical protein